MKASQVFIHLWVNIFPYVFRQSMGTFIKIDQAFPIAQSSLLKLGIHCVRKTHLANNVLAIFTQPDCIGHTIA